MCSSTSIRKAQQPFAPAATRSSSMRSSDVFIMPPNLEELRRRLMKRGTETEEQIATRLQNAAAEMERWREYKYTLISGSMEEDIEKFRAVMRAERYQSRRLIRLS